MTCHVIQRPSPRARAAWRLALAAAGLLAASLLVVDRSSGGKISAAAAAGGATFDPLPRRRPRLRVRPARRRADSRSSPAGSSPPWPSFPRPRRLQPQPMQADRAATCRSTKGSASLAFPITTRDARAQSYFNQGCASLRLQPCRGAARASRRRRSSIRTAPLCFWGEALILGPNINVPMMPEANAPALAALEKAVALKDRAGRQGAGT